MNAVEVDRKLQRIPLDQIDVLNPRERNAREFAEIVENIKLVGLKKPVTVTKRTRSDGVLRYLLLCGEGRVTAFRTLGETSIPALVVDVNDHDAFLVSITENIARRRWSALELLSGIESLHAKGYSSNEIAKKTGLTYGYINDMLGLLKRGEQRLMVAVQSGQISLSAATIIAGAGSDDKVIQAALQDAYEAGTLRGRKLALARQVIERRANLGKSASKRGPHTSKEVTSTALVRTYQREVARQQQVVRKASFAQRRLAFIVGAFQELFADENFATLLRAEGIDTLPKHLAEKIWPDGRHL